MIEDVMQASLPGFVDAVKVSRMACISSGQQLTSSLQVDDFTIGKNALRIVSMRALPDQPHEKEYPREEWIDQGSKEDALDPNRRTEEQKKQDEKEAALQSGTNPEDEDQTGEYARAEHESRLRHEYYAGDYVNFEVSFAYFAPPGTKQLQNANISLIINFFLGSHDWFHIPVPIWIAVQSIVGTVRLRCQMVSQVSAHLRSEGAAAGRCRQLIRRESPT